MLCFVTVLVFKVLYIRTLKRFGLLFWKNVVHLLLLFLSPHGLWGIVHINSQSFILGTLLFPKFHRKVGGGMFSCGKRKKGDVEEK